MAGAATVSSASSTASTIEKVTTSGYASAKRRVAYVRLREARVRHANRCYSNGRAAEAAGRGEGSNPRPLLEMRVGKGQPERVHRRGICFSVCCRLVCMERGVGAAARELNRMGQQLAEDEGSGHKQRLVRVAELRPWRR